MSVLASAAPALADTCPNAALRTGPSAHLGDCRAYEQVSPVAKNGGDVDTVNSSLASRSGDRVLFPTTAALPGAAASVQINYARADRRDGAWTATPIEPPQFNDAAIVSKVTHWASDDLGKVAQVSRVPLAPGAVAGGGNVYVTDTLAGQRALVAGGPLSLFMQAAGTNGIPFRGGTPDLSHLVFLSNDKLTPDALDGKQNVYEWTASAGLRLASVTPPGVPEPAIGFVVDPIRGGRAISADGRRLFFNMITFGPSGDEAVLYMRQDGSETVAISVSHRAADAGTPAPAELATVSEDGSVVYFTSAARLTEDATADGAQAELYRYDIDTAQLRDVSVAHDPADVNGGWVANVIGASKDGRRVFFLARSRLAPGATAGGAPYLYVWENGTIRTIAALDPSVESISVYEKSVSDDGNMFAFKSYGRPLGRDNTSPRCPATNDGNADGQCAEVYVYDAVRDQLSCASCPVDGPSAGHASVGGQAFSLNNRLGRAALDDGRVFFSTPNALVPRDTNGKSDVYQWKAGELSLISSGSGVDGAWFQDATADGRDVFFITGNRLVPQDVDDNVDLYDARIDGGLAGQQSDPYSSAGGCSGDGCRAARGAAPVVPDVATLTATGTAAVPPRRQKPSARVAAPRRVVGSVATVRVRVSGRGRLVVSGPAVRRATRRVARQGTYSLGVRLSPHATRLLAKRGRVTATVRVAFAPAGGASVNARAKVLFLERGGKR